MSRLEDDGGPEVTVIEESSGTGHRQALSVRVGHAWHGRDRAPGVVIWVNYQPEYLRSEVIGPVLIEVATWRQLSRAVRRRLWRRRTARLQRLCRPRRW